MSASTTAAFPPLGTFPASAEVYRAVIARSSEAIGIIDPEGVYLEQNDAHRALIGYADDELVGRTPAIHMGEQTFAKVATALRFAGRFRGDVVTTTRDGRTLTLELSAFTIVGEDGLPVCHVGIKRDVTEQRRAERELQQRYEQLQVLYRMTGALARAGAVEEIYDEALDALERGLGAHRASVLLFDPDGVLRFKAWRGISDGYRAAVEGHTPWTPDTPNPQPITVDDVAADEGLGSALQQTILGEGIRALAFFPLATRGRLLGKFMVYHDRPHPFTAEEVKLAQTIAHHVALAIARRRDDEEIRHAEEEQRFLAQAGSLLAASLELEPTLTAVAHLAVPFLADGCSIDLVDDDGAFRRVATAHGDGSPPAEATEAKPRRGRADPVSRAVRTAKPQLVADAGMASTLVVPLLAHGRTLGALSLLRDGPGRAFAEADLPLPEELARRVALAVVNARLYEAAMAANQAKAEFLAVVSHELRTPLNAILGYTDLLLMGIPQPLAEESRGQAARIETSARHLLRIIEQILAFSRLEAGREEVHPEAVELGELVRETAVLIQPLAGQKSLRFEVELPEAPVPATTDPGKLRQILLNLLSNAVKFTDRGVVGVAMRAADGEVEFEVRDTGVGIAPAYLERVFEPFWQADGSPTRRAGGTGLGLSVTRRLAELLGGTVTAESVAGEGSTFRIRLPLRSPRGDARKIQASAS